MREKTFAIYFVVIDFKEIKTKMSDLPYHVEYSKSNRASCKKCKNKIDKDVLRIAAMIQVKRIRLTLNDFDQNFFFISSRSGTMAKTRTGSTPSASSTNIARNQPMIFSTSRAFATRIKNSFARKLRRRPDFCFPRPARARRARSELLNQAPTPL